MRSSRGFVGRRTERRRLRRFLDEGGPGTVVRGPYGSGKTRLVQEVLGERPDLRVGWVGPDDGGVRLDGRRRARAVPELDDTDATPFDLLVLDEVDPGDGFDASVQQGRDRGAVRLIAIHCDHAARHPPVDDPMVDLPELRIDPLTTEDVTVLAEARLGARLGAHALAVLVERCAGHPLLVTELLDGARSRGDLRADEDGVYRLRGSFEVPGQLAVDLRGRLAGLTSDALEALDLVAIARRLPLGAFGAVATPSVCRELERRGLLIVDHARAVVRCAHPVLADAVLAGQTLPIRGLRHQQVVALLRGRADADPLDLAMWSQLAATPPDSGLLLAGSRAAAARLDLPLAVQLASLAVTARTSGAGTALLDDLTRVGADDAAPEDREHEAGTYGASFAGMAAGHLREVEAPLDETIANLHGQPCPKARLLELQLEFVRHHVQASRGALADARRYAEAARSEALAGRDGVAAGIFSANIGHVARFQGDLAGSDRALAEADHELAARDPLRLRAQLSGHRAIVAAERGRRTEVAALLVRVDAGPGPAAVPRAVLAQRVGGWLAALDRQDAQVTHHFHAAVRIATEGRQPLLALFAAHSAVRLGHAAPFLDDLVAVSTGVEGALAPTLVAHARAAAAEDPVALTAVAYRFATLGARLWAAEAFVLAAEAHAGEDTAASRSCRALAGFIRPLGAERAWILGSGPDDPHLGDRERRVAELAASGWQSRRIATHLGVSTRTVETQVRSVLRKLGITRRRQIPAAPAA
jgi:DNA-binding CsgD family transcriptional regulator